MYKIIKGGNHQNHNGYKLNRNTKSFSIEALQRVRTKNVSPQKAGDPLCLAGGRWGGGIPGVSLPPVCHWLSHNVWKANAKTTFVNIGLDSWFFSKPHAIVLMHTPNNFCLFNYENDMKPQIWYEEWLQKEILCFSFSNTYRTYDLAT